MDPTVRRREKGREGECNYQLAKCIHIPSQKDWDVGGGKRAGESEGGRKTGRCMKGEVVGTERGGGGVQSEGLLVKWMQGRKQG